MKKYLGVFVTLFLLRGIGFAGMGEGEMPMNNNGGGMKEKGMKQGQSMMEQGQVMMEHGKMMMMQDGNEMPMGTDMSMPNGTTVKTDGTVVAKDMQAAKLRVRCLALGVSLDTHGGACELQFLRMRLQLDCVDAIPIVHARSVVGRRGSSRYAARKRR